jgi:hypothetical protein
VKPWDQEKNKKGRRTEEEPKPVLDEELIRQRPMGETLISPISSLLSSPFSAPGLLSLSHKDGDLIEGLLVLWEGRCTDKRGRPL